MGILRRLIIPLLAAPALLGGCGGAESPTATTASATTPRPVSTPRASAEVLPVDEDGLVAPGTGDRVFVDVRSNGAGGAGTRIRVVRPGNSNRMVRTIPGRWALPQAVPGQTEGFSWNGARIVLVSSDDPGRFIAVAADDATARLVDVHPSGRFVYDGVARDGTRLFLTEVAEADGAAAYKIRVVDLATGALAPGAVVDKLAGGGGEAMVGQPVARATVADFIYTVYERRDGAPFVHALDAMGNYALCLDLPKDANAAARTGWSARRIGPDAVVIANSVMKSAYRVVGGSLTPTT